MHPHNQTNSLLFCVLLKTFQNSKEIFPSLLKYTLPTSIKMKIFNIKSFLCSFHRTITEYFATLLCYRAQKGKKVFLPLVTKQDHHLCTCCSLTCTLILLKFESIVVYL